MTLEEIEQAIARLPPEDIAKLRVWLAQLASPYPQPPPQPGAGLEGGTAVPTERTVEPESTAEKLGRFAGRAFADLRRRVREK